MDYPVSSGNVSWKYFDERAVESTVYDRNNELITSDINDKISAKAKTFLEMFGLMPFYHKKLSLKDVLSVRKRDQSMPTRIEDLPWMFLEAIVSGNSQFRETLLYDFIINQYDDSSDCYQSSSDNSEDEEAENEEVSDSSSYLDKTPKTEFENQTPAQYVRLHSERQAKHISDSIIYSSDFVSSGDSDIKKETSSFDLMDMHPSDFFLAVFLCCDLFVRKLIVQRMASCRYAVPLIFTKLSGKDVFISLWPLRQIFIDEKSIASVASSPLPSVAFMRLGSGLQKSKSIVVNEFLCEDKHSTFFNAECRLGNNDPIFANGLVEMTWTYLDEKDMSQILVYNLRGDLITHEKQADILRKISDVVVIILNRNELRGDKISQVLERGKAKTIIMTDLTEQQSKAKKKTISADFIATANVHTIDLRRTLLKKLRKQFKKIKERGLQSLDTRLKEYEKHTDFHECHELIKGENLADTLLTSHIKESEHFSKEEMLPIQGDFWKRWSEKYFIYRKAKDKYDVNEPEIKEMKEIRRKQIEKCNEKSESFIATFVQILIEHQTQDASILRFFVSRCQQILDIRSRNELIKLHDKYRALRSEYDQTSRKEYVPILGEVKTKILYVSFGLEHIFREMGQIYEAFMGYTEDMVQTLSDKTKSILKSMTQIAAKLFTEGQPLEIMDGDAANIPLKWVKAVFKELENQIGKQKKIVTISIIGVQSSGKSTLLNTMFGVQFAVGGGRTTSGIYAQLIPVVQHSIKDIDYIMILDTEGLRASHVLNDKEGHDNKLATLVMGLADLSIVNIKGEVMTDLKDILDIVVYGFIRLKKTKVQGQDTRQNGIFVHQNTSSQAILQDILSRQAGDTVDRLDKVTKEIAKKEDIGLTRFQDVIKFEPSKDVKHLPELHIGSKSLAPVNPEYSRRAKDVATYIFTKLAQLISSRSIMDIMSQLESLWEGILSEDLIFNFRNALDAKALDTLEVELQRCVWEVDHFSIKLSVSTIRKILLEGDPQFLEERAKNLEDKHISKIDAKSKLIKEELLRYMEKSDYRQYIMPQKDITMWKFDNKCEYINSVRKNKSSREQNNVKNTIQG